MKKYIKEIPTAPICEIWWADHYTQEAWKDLDDDSTGAIVMSSVGYLLSEDEHYYRMAQSLSSDKQKNYALHILKSDVLKIKIIKGKIKGSGN